MSSNAIYCLLSCRTTLRVMRSWTCLLSWPSVIYSLTQTHTSTDNTAMIKATGRGIEAWVTYRFTSYSLTGRSQPKWSVKPGDSAQESLMNSLLYHLCRSPWVFCRDTLGVVCFYDGQNFSFKNFQHVFPNESVAFEQKRCLHINGRMWHV